MVKRAHDVRVLQAFEAARLAPESLRGHLVLAERLMQDLERHLSGDGQIERAVDRRRTARPDALAQLVAVGDDAPSHQPAIAPRPWRWW